METILGRRVLTFVNIVFFQRQPAHNMHKLIFVRIIKIIVI